MRGRITSVVSDKNTLDERDGMRVTMKTWGKSYSIWVTEERAMAEAYKVGDTIQMDVAQNGNVLGIVGPR